MTYKQTITERQFLSAQKKAFKIWLSIVKEDNLPLYWTGFYVAYHPSVCYYVVTYPSAGHGINSATGMFRFTTESSANKFIKEMGDDIQYLFPSYEIKRVKKTLKSEPQIIKQP